MKRINYILSIKDILCAKKEMIDDIKQSIINPKDKLKLCMQIATCESIIQLHILYSNAKHITI